jgi:hypothetical protein
MKLGKLAVLGLFAATALSFTAAARAQTLVVDASPIFGAGPASSMTSGWNEIVVRLRNPGTAPVKGKAIASSSRWTRTAGAFESEAGFVVAPGAVVSLRVPIEVESYTDTNLRVVGEDGHELSSLAFSPAPESGPTMLEIAEPPRLRASLNEQHLTPGYVPFNTHARSAGPQLSVATARVDATTGDPILPDRVAVYASVDVVVLRTDQLARIGATELQALGDFVLGGGTIALSIARPEDLHNPVVEALVGGAITRQTVSAITLKAGPTETRRPAEATALSGYVGGNLRADAFGSFASYGLGEVHLLAFDLAPSVVADPWVQGRMLQLASRAYDRRAVVAFRPGSASNSPPTEVRKLLDPNESSRWAIAAAALFLCLYAVLAGPINFSSAAKKGRPLRALIHLPIWSLGAFLFIVFIGFVAKGIGGRARHLTLVEVGAGMPRGIARRFRGFYASQSSDLTIRPTDVTSLANVVILNELSDPKRRMVSDRDGARLVDVTAIPWQTIVVREDGASTLGNGVSMLESGEDLAITNRTGRALRGAMLRWSGGTRYFGPIADGARVLASSGKPATAFPGGAGWDRAVDATILQGAVNVHALRAAELAPAFGADTGLADAWRAIDATAGEPIDWFPDGTPVLIAQMDGGEGKSSDSGLRLESDRVLIRVVGFGGAP